MEVMNTITNETCLQSEERALANYLAKRICMRASGRLNQECHRNYPRDEYFIGNLRPIPIGDPEVSHTPTWLGDLFTKLRPMAFGADFLVKVLGSEVEIEVYLSWSCYFRLFPTFDQQREHQRMDSSGPTTESDYTLHNNNSSTDLSSDTEIELDENSDIEEDPEAILTSLDRQNSRQRTDSLFIRFRKIECKASGKVRICQHNGVDQWEVDLRDLNDAIKQEIRRAKEVVINHPDRLRVSETVDSQIRIPQIAMASKESYTRFLSAFNSEIIPEWRWDIQTTVKEFAQSHALSLLKIKFEFANTTLVSESSRNAEPFLFDPTAKFEIKSGGQIEPYELDQAPKGFRYNRELWGRGFNCAVVKDGEFIQTKNTPIYEQMRYSTQSTLSAPFAVLAKDPLPTLDKILDAMNAYMGEWRAIHRKYQRNKTNWNAEFNAEFKSDFGKYANEIRRFEKGLKLLRQNPDLLLAFRLTNEVFRRGPNNEWRIFQIVFLITQLAGIIALSNRDPDGLSERERVDIIYFPTGGGKTEAYLGVTIFHCFFDRLRGKSAGVTAWARFPLRLLTVQQMQRFADIVGVAEIVRLEQNDRRLNGPGVDGFAVGYFVGQRGTPNDLKEPRPNDPPDPTWSKAMDPDARQEWKTIMRCPACKTSSVTVDLDCTQVRLVHKCSNAGCQFPHGIVPVYIVDNEIYRYLPSVIVGTIDKLAAIGNQRKFSLLLGEVDGNCEQHGYFKKQCCQKNCNNRRLLHFNPPRGISGPSLFIQDELHLLREGLGTFDSHYETFTQRLLFEFGQSNSLKIIASSATIEAFERQVEHLYGRDKSLARVFPAPGPTLGKSFYAQTLDYPQRIYLGMIPHNKTIFNAVLELIEYYQIEIQRLQKWADKKMNPYGGKLIPGTTEWTELIDLYATSVTYFLKGRDLNSIRTDLESHVNTKLQHEGYNSTEIFELTGSTNTDEVTKILDKLQSPIQAVADSPVVLATSMISHGVDVDRLNAMFFYGVPRQNAEYIQASSRVGRSHVGLVFTCLHPARERDQSHYLYFLKFHEYLGQLVEPVAINRWSKFSVERTLPGLFMAVLLQLIANRSNNEKPNRYYLIDLVKREIRAGRITVDHFVPLLQEAYTSSAPEPEIADYFAEKIRLLVQKFFDQIISAGAQHKWVSEAIYPSPMRSLRDVDEALDIILDDAGTKWGRQDQ